MNTDTTATNVEVVETPVAVAAAPVIVKLDLAETAGKIAAANQFLVVRPTESTGYRILGTVENTDLNWKKGLFYVLNCFSKGFNLEMQAYSVKGGAHLAEFRSKFEDFASEKISIEKFGYAFRLRVKLPFAMGEEAMIAAATEFIALIDPEVQATRLLLKDEDFVSKKESKAKAKLEAEAAKAAAAAPVATEPVAEAPAQETPAPTAEAPAPAVVSKAAKKAAKRK